MNIHGKLVTLRAICQKDSEILQQWSNDPSLWEMLGGWHFPFPIESTQKWIERLPQDSLNQRFAIEAPGMGIIGTANLVEIDWKNRHAFHGMMLGNKDIRGKGFGKDTIMAIMRYAFEELGMQRLDGSFIEYNTTSIAVYEKCGWKIEGRLRQWYFRNNRFWDKLIAGITKEDYHQYISENDYWKG
jgi:RimJ/RimL family protein N-acetyltransferase